MHPASLVATLLLVGAAPAALAADPPAAPPERITDRLKAQAESLAPLVQHDLAKRFLAATPKLAEPSARTVFRNTDRSRAVSPREFEAMSDAERADFAPREYPPDFYYETGYGSIGQLQLLAQCGFEAHGVDVEPVFPALYSDPADTGPIGPGSVTIHLGQWPADEKLRTAIGGGYSLITSKNTLKKGYIHPSPPPGQTVDPKRLVHLGVGDEEFLRRVHESLVPGGVFVIYNICPPQNPPDREYIPWADGLSPFPREMLERAGFEVLAFDAVDQAWTIDAFGACGYVEGKTKEEAAKEFLCWYTLVRRKD